MSEGWPGQFAESDCCLWRSELFGVMELARVEFPSTVAQTCCVSHTKSRMRLCLGQEVVPSASRRKC